MATPITPWVTGKKIGKVQEARAALRLHRKMRRAYAQRQRPDGIDYRTGMRYLSEGAVRTTFVNAKRTVVYKITHSNAPRANRSEYERMVAIWNADPALRKHTIPVSIFEIDGIPIIAMKFIEKGPDALNRRERDAKYNALWEARRRYSMVMNGKDEIRDMHDGNWRIDRRGTPVFTDLGDVIWGDELTHSSVATAKSVSIRFIRTGDKAYTESFDSNCDCEDCRKPLTLTTFEPPKDLDHPTDVMWTCGEGPGNCLGWCSPARKINRERGFRNHLGDPILA